MNQRPAVRSIVRRGVKFINSPIAKARLRKTLANSPGPIWLEIGGHGFRDGWIVTNTNAVARLYLDAAQPWPIEKASVEYVYSDNVIEHLTLESGRRMLREARRSLKPGGIIRIVTPDLRAHVELYLRGEVEMDNSIAGHYKKSGLVVEHPVDLIRIPIASFGHHLGYVYDYESLSAELQLAGFTDVRRCQLGESEHEPLRGLDSRVNSGQVAVEAIA